MCFNGGNSLETLITYRSQMAREGDQLRLTLVHHVHGRVVVLLGAPQLPEQLHAVILLSAASALANRVLTWKRGVGCHLKSRMRCYSCWRNGVATFAIRAHFS